MDYTSSGGVFSSLRTSMWFVLGMMFVVPAGVILGKVFHLSARWVGDRVAWGGMAALSIGLSMWAVSSVLPATRLKHVFGENAMQVAVIERLNTRDSFNDGVTYTGCLSGPPALLERIRAHRGLQPIPESYKLEFFWHDLRDIASPKMGELWGSRYLRVLATEDRERYYFVYRSVDLEALQKEAISAHSQ